MRTSVCGSYGYRQQADGALLHVYPMISNGKDTHMTYNEIAYGA